MTVRMNPKHAGLWLIFLFTASACDLLEPPQYQLEPAILDGDVHRVQRLLDNPKVDVNWRPGGTGTTLLTTAAAHGKLEIAKILLQRGADPNLGSDLNETPLLSAAYHGDLKMCELLIEAGADVNQAGGRYGWTPLRNATYKRHAEVVQLLIKHGATH